MSNLLNAVTPPSLRHRADNDDAPSLTEPEESFPFRPAALLAKLEGETASGEGRPLPSSLPVSRISALPELFQCRPLADWHVADIVKAVQAGAELPPLLVVQAGDRMVVLDGHHRLEALRLAGCETARVEEFRGTLREGVLAACAANSLTKLPMSKTERTDAAWKFVLLGVGSKATIARAAGVAEGTVANMRRLKAKLGDEAFEIAGWAKAMLVAANSNPADMTDEDREEWLEATAHRHAGVLARTFGAKLAKNPEVTARALAIHLGRRLDAVVMELRPYLSEAEEDY